MFLNKSVAFKMARSTMPLRAITQLSGIVVNIGFDLQVTKNKCSASRLSKLSFGCCMFACVRVCYCQLLIIQPCIGHHHNINPNGKLGYKFRVKRPVLIKISSATVTSESSEPGFFRLATSSFIYASCRRFFLLAVIERPRGNHRR